jgi:hypothetical protein
MVERATPNRLVELSTGPKRVRRGVSGSHPLAPSSHVSAHPPLNRCASVTLMGENVTRTEAQNDNLGLLVDETDMSDNGSPKFLYVEFKIANKR